MISCIPPIALGHLRTEGWRAPFFSFSVWKYDWRRGIKKNSTEDKIFQRKTRTKTEQVGEKHAIGICSLVKNIYSHRERFSYWREKKIVSVAYSVYPLKPASLQDKSNKTISARLLTLAFEGISPMMISRTDDEECGFGQAENIFMSPICSQLGHAGFCLFERTGQS